MFIKIPGALPRSLAAQTQTAKDDLFSHPSHYKDMNMISRCSAWDLDKGSIALFTPELINLCPLPMYPHHSLVPLALTKILYLLDQDMHFCQRII